MQTELIVAFLGQQIEYSFLVSLRKAFKQISSTDMCVKEIKDPNASHSDVMHTLSALLSPEKNSVGVTFIHTYIRTLLVPDSLHLSLCTVTLCPDIYSTYPNEPTDATKTTDRLPFILTTRRKVLKVAHRITTNNIRNFCG